MSHFYVTPGWHDRFFSRITIHGVHGMVHGFSWAVWTFKSSWSNRSIFIFTGSWEIHIHIHEFIAMSIFIFTVSWIFIHGFTSLLYLKFMSSWIWAIFIFMGSCFSLYSYSCVHNFFMNKFIRLIYSTYGSKSSW